MSVTIHDYVQQGIYASFIEQLYGGATTIEEYHSILAKLRATNKEIEERRKQRLLAKEAYEAAHPPLFTPLGSLEGIKAACIMWTTHPNDPVFKFEHYRRRKLLHDAEAEKTRKRIEKAALRKLQREQKSLCKKADKEFQKACMALDEERFQSEVAAAIKRREDDEALDLMTDLASACQDTYNAVEVNPYDFYREVFKMHLDPHPWIQDYRSYGNLDDDSANAKANPLVHLRNEGAYRGKYRIMFRDTFKDVLDEAYTYDFAVCSGLTYFGKSNRLENASKMFAMIFDIDYVNQETFRNFMSGATNGIYPMPNYIVLSGHGIHLYYLFDQPIDLYPKTKEELNKIKHSLTTRMWNKYTVAGFGKGNEHKVQYQSIDQAFRMGGSKTKIEDYRSRIFRFSNPQFTIEDMLQYVDEATRKTINMDDLLGISPYGKSKYPLAVAKVSFPQWYEDRIIKKKPKKTFVVNRAFYDWYKRQIKSYAVFGKRYYVILVLAIIGLKCAIDYKEIITDAYSYHRFLNNVSPDKPFTADDISGALEILDADDERKHEYINYTRAKLEELSGIPMKETKRNGSSRAEHLELMALRLKQKSKREGHNVQGRKSQKDTILEWRRAHPNGKKADCVRDTGLTKPTVYKWWGDK